MGVTSARLSEIPPHVPCWAALACHQSFKFEQFCMLLPVALPVPCCPSLSLTCATPLASTALALSLDCLAYMRLVSSHTSSDLGQRSHA